MRAASHDFGLTYMHAVMRIKRHRMRLQIFQIVCKQRKTSEDNEKCVADECRPINRFYLGFYDASLHEQFPLTGLLSDRKYWSVAEWPDGCECYAVRHGTTLEQNCCCISSVKPNAMDNAVRSEHEHRFRFHSFRDFLCLSIPLYFM